MPELRSRTSRPLWTPVLMILAVAGGARGDQDPSLQNGDPTPFIDCSTSQDSRFAFLQGRLEGNTRYARLWWHTWTSTFMAGMAFEGVRAGLEDDRGERAISITSAVKSTIGLGRAILSRPTAMRGQVSLLEQGIASCHEAIRLAEERLRESAEQARKERWSWWPHVFNFALNATGAVVVAETYDEDAAYWSGALGFAIGELRIWSFPWQGERDWKEYRRHHGPVSKPEPTWHLEATPRGARLVVRF